MVKIADVARHAQVSASTVSYVLSGKRPISAEVQARVQESIKTLGYHPHAGARSLASRRSNVIALVVPLRTGVHVPVQMQFVTSVVTSARRYDHDVLLLTQDEGESGLRRVSGSSLADALIIMDIELDDPRLPALRELTTPSVLIGFPTDTTGITCVDLDFIAVGELCVDYLHGLGHRRLALFGSPHQVYERRAGYATKVAQGFGAAAARNGIAASTHPFDGGPTEVNATVRELLERHPDLTGVVVHNEPIMGPVLQALRDCGRRVPQDVSVLAIGPDDLISRFDLSGVALPVDDVGHTAVELVMAKLDGHQVRPATMLPPQLTARASTGPAPCRSARPPAPSSEQGTRRD
jgi:DNA-binding LacI/PurR family transcriptional regulator